MVDKNSNTHAGTPTKALAALIAIWGAAQLAGGAWLLTLHGSPYFITSGIVMVIGAALLWQRHRHAAAVFHLLLVGTLGWAWWETGGAAWGMCARLGFIFAMWLLVMGVTRRRPLPAIGPRVQILGWLVLTVASLTLGGSIAGDSPPGATQPQDVDQDWPVYGRTPHATRFSPLAQITPQNVDELGVAWVFRTGDLPTQNDSKQEFTFEATPLKVGDTLYLCTPHNIVIALDAATGRLRWRFDPKVQGDASYMKTCRGVAYYKAEQPGLECPERILAGTIDGRMVAVDAHTGVPCPGFGHNGEISLLLGLGAPPAGFAFLTSPPLVIGNVAVVGGWVTDDYSVGEPSGAIRAFDVITGNFAWAWDMGRPGETGLPAPGQTFTKGSPNSWPPMSADPELGLVYLPMGNATPDLWGAHRSAVFEKYASAIVALDVQTGQPRWSFQTVHHDIWDYDVSSNPILFDLKRDGQVTPALAQVTKMGQIFVLDRRTGTPLIPIDEEPVPQHPAPGEWLSPTQPVSSVPTLGPPRLTEAQMWGITPLDQIACRIDYLRNRYDGPYTPESVGGSIIYPGPYGATDWGGATIDEDRGLLIASTSWVPFIVHLIPRKEVDEILARTLREHLDPTTSGVAMQLGTPFGFRSVPMLSPLGIPCLTPPWGRLMAIDLAESHVSWNVVLGTSRDNGPFGTHLGLPLKTGVMSMGGPTATRGGVTFIAATLDNYIRAFETSTGRELWRERLPAGGQASPMTYWADGRQFVVICAGGHGALRTKYGDYVIAYALPPHARKAAM
jgi:membrane-bound PQQ-dependent dehydrogenase (glucose/quinate/shikimate family)